MQLLLHQKTFALRPQKNPHQLPQKNPAHIYLSVLESSLQVFLKTLQDLLKHLILKLGSSSFDRVFSTPT